MPRLPPTRERDVFTELPSVVAQAVARVAEKAVKFVTLEVQANLQSAPQEGGTPVKTGYARASWIPSIAQPSLATGGSKQAVNPAIAEAGAASVLTYRLGMGAVFVSNNVPYILKLNAGHSRQAPAGFVDAAVERAVGATERAFGGGQ